MSDRLLFTVHETQACSAYSVTLHGSIPCGNTIQGIKDKPSLILVTKTKISSELAAGALSPEDIELVVLGDPDRWCILECATEAHSDRTGSGHTSFEDECAEISEHLGRLSHKIIEGLLKFHPELDLARKSSGRWVNSHSNFVTFKPQPRKQDIQFTLYGNPDRFTHKDFLKQDQNSYSRGWIASEGDVKTFLELAYTSLLLKK